MQSGIRLAIGGKGGVGKTTLCAIWAHLFAKDGFDVLAIDADPNVNLALALGVSLDKCPQPLISMKKLIAERTGTDRDSAAIDGFAISDTQLDRDGKPALQIDFKSIYFE